MSCWDEQDRTKRRWMVVEPDGGDPERPVTYIWTEQEILDAYYDSWVKDMAAVGRTHLISERHCIEDWVTVNWAERLDDPTEDRPIG